MNEKHEELLVSQVSGLTEAVRGLQDCTKEIKDDMRNMKENHLAHIERSVGQMSNDLNWLKKFFWIVAGGLIANFVASLIKIV